MTNLDRNMRTLIVCFVLAVGVLTPLRFLAGGSVVNEEVKVLGETEEMVLEDPVSEEPENEVVEMSDDSIIEVNDIVLPDVGGLN